jgi:hypothetical protein
MPNITQIRLILKQPLPIILRKIRTLVIEKILHKWWQKKYTIYDYRKPHLNNLSFQVGLSDINQITCNSIDNEVQSYLVGMYLNHRFDLLGSGWIKNSYHSESPGIEGIKYQNPLQKIKIDSSGEWLSEVVTKSHLDFSKKIWKKILSKNNNYQPIDWQKDYKSGFRFNSRTSYLQQNKLVVADGIDLKMPWELGRLQHLPQLAIFYKNNPESIHIIKEFKCQLLDFIMTNPIGMGVNWTCTMDVGIRVANICLAYDWFKQLDSEKILDEEFDHIVLNYIYFHGVHIFNNFEYKEGLTSNHYLGNIAGLTYLSCYLTNFKENDFWLAYSIQELNNELKRQFFNDGSNFEGSTAYHRLSGEMMVYCFGVLHKVSDEKLKILSKINSKSFNIKANYKKTDFTNKEFLSSSTIDALYKMSVFTLAYTKPDGNITQIGDNDSGRFFKLTPCGEFLTIENAFKKYSNLIQTIDYHEPKFWDENNVNHASFISAINGFFNSTSLNSYSNFYSTEYSLIKSLIKRTYNPIPQKVKIVDQNVVFPSYKKSTIQEIGLDVDNLIVNYFADFGFISISNKNLFISISFGCNKKSHHSWGHYHNDKLAIELQLNNKDIFLDPGTYIYTPIPKERNKFRSTAYHNTISIKEIEQNYFNTTRAGLFSLKQEVETMVTKLSSTHIIVKAEYNEIVHVREIKLSEKKLEITDYCNQPFEQDFSKNPYSNGYGKLIQS